MFNSESLRFKILLAVICIGGALAVYWIRQMDAEEIAPSDQIERALVSATPDGVIPPDPEERTGAEVVEEMVDAAIETTTPPSEERKLITGKTGFRIETNDFVNPYREFGLFILPGDMLDLRAAGLQQAAQSRLDAGVGVTQQTGGHWRWQAPATPGLYPLRAVDEIMGETINVNAFVLTPHDPQQDALNGYRIGRYEAEPLRGDPAYIQPAGFIELTAENADVRLSPHFKLRQFRCKQVAEGTYPQYLILKEKLLLKLEMILEEVNRRGIEANTLHVMSGFRTPYYNKSIGNTTVYSRHLYGDAADIFVDTDEDGMMDDLNNDGQITRADAEVLADIVKDLAKEERYKPYVGGLGIYSPAPHRGPFIHIDVRGTPARW